MDPYTKQIGKPFWLCWSSILSAYRAAGSIKLTFSGWCLMLCFTVTLLILQWELWLHPMAQPAPAHLKCHASCTAYSIVNCVGNFQGSEFSNLSFRLSKHGEIVLMVILITMVFWRKFAYNYMSSLALWMTLEYELVDATEVSKRSE